MASKLIFGFGSLIETASLLATVPDAANIRPAYIKGFIREFNLWDMQGYTVSNLDVAGIPFCALDLKKVDDPEVKLNGVVFDASEAYIAALLEREHDYELIPTTAYDFETDETMGECFVFYANKQNGTYDFGSVAQERYLQNCLKGAREYGDRFYREFLKTTYINGKPLSKLRS